MWDAQGYGTQTLLCYSVNIKYISLSFQSGIPDSPGMSKAMVEQKQKERKFLEQLLDGKKVENYTIPVPIKAELRKYQQVSKLFHSIEIHRRSLQLCTTTRVQLHSS